MPADSDLNSHVGFPGCFLFFRTRVCCPKHYGSNKSRQRHNDMATTAHVAGVKRPRDAREPMSTVRHAGGRPRVIIKDVNAFIAHYAQKHGGSVSHHLNTMQEYMLHTPCGFMTRELAGVVLTHAGLKLEGSLVAAAMHDAALVVGGAMHEPLAVIRTALTAAHCVHLAAARGELSWHSTYSPWAPFLPPAALIDMYLLRLLPTPDEVTALAVPPHMAAAFAARTLRAVQAALAKPPLSPTSTASTQETEETDDLLAGDLEATTTCIDALLARGWQHIDAAYKAAGSKAAPATVANTANTAPVSVPSTATTAAPAAAHVSTITTTTTAATTAAASTLLACEADLDAIRRSYVETRGGIGIALPPGVPLARPREWRSLDVLAAACDV